MKYLISFLILSCNLPSLHAFGVKSDYILNLNTHTFFDISEFQLNSGLKPSSVTSYDFSKRPSEHKQDFSIEYDSLFKADDPSIQLGNYSLIDSSKLQFDQSDFSLTYDKDLLPEVDDNTEVDCDELFTTELMARMKISDIADYAIDDLGINRYDSGYGYSNMGINIEMENIDLSTFQDAKGVNYTSNGIISSYLAAHNQNDSIFNLQGNRLGLTISCAEYGVAVCPGELVDQCTEQLVKNELRFKIRERENKKLLIGCSKNTKGIILPENFKGLLDRFDFDKCMSKSRRNDKCECLKDKKDIMLDEKIKKSNAVNIRGALIAQHIGQAVKGLNEIISANKVLELSGKMDSADQNVLNIMKQCTEMDVAVSDALVDRCEKNDVAMEFVSRVIKNNGVGDGNISTPDQLISFFKNTVTQLQSKKSYDPKMYSGIMDKYESFDKTIINSYEDKDRALYNILTRETEKELKQYVLDMIKNRGLNKSVDMTKLKELMAQNPVFKITKFNICMDGTYDPECLNELLGPAGLSLDDPNLEQKLKDPSVSLIDPLYAEGAEDISIQCSHVINHIFQVCESAVSEKPEGINHIGVENIFMGPLRDSQNDPEKFRALNIQKQIFSCAVSYENFDPSLKKMIEGGFVPTMKDLDVYRGVSKDLSEGLALVRGNGGLLSSPSKEGYEKLNKSISSDTIKSVISSLKPVSEVSENSNVDGTVVRPNVDNSKKSILNDIKIAMKNIDSGDSPKQSLFPQNGSLSPGEMAELNAKADRKIDSINSSISDKEKKIAELERQLKQSNNLNGNENKESGHSDQTTKELLDLIQQLKGDVSSLKNELKVVKTQKQQMNVAKQQSQKQITNSYQASQRPKQSSFNSFSTSSAKRQESSPRPSPIPNFSSGSLSATSRSSSASSPKGASSASSRSVSLSSNGGGFGSSVGNLLTVSMYRSSELLRPENKNELYQLLQEKGKIYITTPSGKLELVEPVLDSKGRVIGSKIIKIEKDKKVAKKVEKKTVAKKEDSKESEQRNAYYEYLKSLFSK